MSEQSTSSPLTVELRADPGAHLGLLLLAGKATYREAVELRSALFAAIETVGDGPLAVDLTMVEQLDTAAMAVLVEGLIAAEEARAVADGGPQAGQQRGPEIFLSAPSQAVREVFALAGLEEALDRCVDCVADVHTRLGLAPDGSPIADSPSGDNADDVTHAGS